MSVGIQRKERCPHCGQDINRNTLRDVTGGEPIRCPNCHEPLRPNQGHTPEYFQKF